MLGSSPRHSPPVRPPREGGWTRRSLDISECDRGPGTPVRARSARLQLRARSLSLRGAAHACGPRVLWRECSYFSSTSAARFKNVTILGGGLMGNGITQVTAAAGYNVTMVRRTRVRPPATALALRACPPLQAGLRSAHPSLTRTPHPRRHTGGRDAGALGQVDGQH